MYYRKGTIWEIVQGTCTWTKEAWARRLGLIEVKVFPPFRARITRWRGRRCGPIQSAHCCPTPSIFLTASHHLLRLVHLQHYDHQRPVTGTLAHQPHCRRYSLSDSSITGRRFIKGHLSATSTPSGAVSKPRPPNHQKTFTKSISVEYRQDGEVSLLTHEFTGLRAPFPPEWRTWR